jgi:hypothetical protein
MTSSKKYWTAHFTEGRLFVKIIMSASRRAVQERFHKEAGVPSKNESVNCHLFTLYNSYRDCETLVNNQKSNFDPIFNATSSTYLLSVYSADSIRYK